MVNTKDLKTIQTILILLKMSIEQGYDVEVDIWFISETFFLGHDETQYGITLEWLLERSENLWVHCKHIDAIEEFKRLELEQKITKINYFYHQQDDVTITSHGHLWKYPGIPQIKNCVSVMLKYIEKILKDVMEFVLII